MVDLLDLLVDDSEKTVNTTDSIHVECTENQDTYEKEAYGILMDLKNVKPMFEVGKKHALSEDSTNSESGSKKARKAPMASKCCNTCKVVFQVVAPQKKCGDVSCNGVLELVAKEKKELKRAPPKCNKFCNNCNMTIENIATAVRKCHICKSNLEKVSTAPKLVVAEAKTSTVSVLGAIV